MKTYGLVVKVLECQPRGAHSNLTTPPLSGITFLGNVKNVVQYINIV